jgi:hypothetical protein
VLGLEPLPVAVDQGDGRHRDAEDASNQAGDAVERLLLRGVEHVIVVQRREPVLLVARPGLNVMSGFVSHEARLRDNIFDFVLLYC